MRLPLNSPQYGVGPLRSALLPKRFASTTCSSVNSALIILHLKATRIVKEWSIEIIILIFWCRGVGAWRKRDFCWLNVSIDSTNCKSEWVYERFSWNRSVAPFIIWNFPSRLPHTISGENLKLLENLSLEFGHLLKNFKKDYVFVWMCLLSEFALTTLKTISMLHFRFPLSGSNVVVSLWAGKVVGSIFVLRGRRLPS